MDGVTIIDAPVPINVVPQPPIYHFQLALAPNIPPTTCSVTGLPGHTEPLFLLTEVAATDKFLAVSNTPGEIYLQLKEFIFPCAATISL